MILALEENPDASVLSTASPPNVTASGHLEGMRRAVGIRHEFDQWGTDLRIFDRLANLRSITVTEPRVEARGPVADCGWRVEDAWVRLGSLPGPAASGPEVIQLGYVTGQAATLHLTVGRYEQAVAASPGAGRASFVVTGYEGALRVRVTNVASGGLCVSDVVAGSPWPAD